MITLFNMVYDLVSRLVCVGCWWVCRIVAFYGLLVVWVYCGFFCLCCVCWLDSLSA